MTKCKYFKTYLGAYIKFAEVPALSLSTTDLASFIDATLFDIFLSNATFRN